LQQVKTKHLPAKKRRCPDGCGRNRWLVAVGIGILSVFQKQQITQS